MKRVLKKVDSGAEQEVDSGHVPDFCEFGTGLL